MCLLCLRALPFSTATAKEDHTLTLCSAHTQPFNPKPNLQMAAASALASALKSSETTFGDPLQAAASKQMQQDPLAQAAVDSPAATAQQHTDSAVTPVTDLLPADVTADAIAAATPKTDTPDLDAAAAQTTGDAAGGPCTAAAPPKARLLHDLSGTSVVYE